MSASILLLLIRFFGFYKSRSIPYLICRVFSRKNQRAPKTSESSKRVSWDHSFDGFLGLFAIFRDFRPFASSGRIFFKYFRIISPKTEKKRVLSAFGRELSCKIYNLSCTASEIFTTAADLGE